MCECISHNAPDWSGGTQPEAILPMPKWLNPQKESRSVCVDACLKEVILALWETGIGTLGSCCGHNKERPDIVLVFGTDPQRVREILQRFPKRDWKLLQWNLTEV